MLDVFDEEPLPPESPLWTTPNLVITPHVTCDDPRYIDRLFDPWFENFERFLAGKRLKNVVDRRLGVLRCPDRRSDDFGCYTGRLGRSRTARNEGPCRYLPFAPLCSGTLPRRTLVVRYAVLRTYAPAQRSTRCDL